MSTIATAQSAAELARTLVERILENALDEAERLLDQLNDTHPETRRHIIFPVMLAMQRGRLHDAWQLVNGLPDEEAGPLKALCLRRLEDPSWHGYAEANRDHSDPYVRKAMRKLLGCEEETDQQERV